MGAFSRIQTAAEDAVLAIARERRTFDDLTIDDMFPYVRQSLPPTASIAWQNQTAARALEIVQGDLSEALPSEFRKMLRQVTWAGRLRRAQ